MFPMFRMFRMSESPSLFQRSQSLFQRALLPAQQCFAQLLPAAEAALAHLLTTQSHSGSEHRGRPLMQVKGQYTVKRESSMHTA